MHFEENITKDRIVLLLKKTGGMTAEDLSRQIGITPMGVRQHLLSLERKGLVEYEARKHGIGRPVFIYRLTEKADGMFPKGYHQLALDILKEIEALDGKNKVTDLFRLRKEKLFKERSTQLESFPSLADKLKGLARVLSDEGYLVEVAENGRDFVLSQFNCPVSKVAHEYPEACRYELELMRDLLGAGLNMSSCMANGDTSCRFVIPRA